MANAKWPIAFRCCVSLLLPLVFATDVHAQTLGGSVLDAVTGTAVAGVTIQAVDPRGVELGRVVSDSAGLFRILLPRADRYQLRAYHPAYATHTTEFVRLRRNEQIALELRLGPQVVTLAPLIVTARTRHAVSRLAEFYDRMERQRRIGLGRFITREEIENTSTTNVLTLLEREPDIQIFRSAPAPSAPLGASRQDLLRAALNVRKSGVSEVITINRRGGLGAGEGCRPMIYLDGMLLGRSDNVELSSFVDVDEIEGIELYRSGLETPGEMADACGSIGVWTRRSISNGNPFTWPRVRVALGFAAAAFLVEVLRN